MWSALWWNRSSYSCCVLVSCVNKLQWGNSTQQTADVKRSQPYFTVETFDCCGVFLTVTSTGMTRASSPKILIFFFLKRSRDRESNRDKCSRCLITFHVCILFSIQFALHQWGACFRIISSVWFTLSASSILFFFAIVSTRLTFLIRFLVHKSSLPYPMNWLHKLISFFPKHPLIVRRQHFRMKPEKRREREKKKKKKPNDLNCSHAIRLTRRRDKEKYQKDKY